MNNTIVDSLLEQQNDPELTEAVNNLRLQFSLAVYAAGNGVITRAHRAANSYEKHVGRQRVDWRPRKNFDGRLVNAKEGD